MDNLTLFSRLRSLAAQCRREHPTLLWADYADCDDRDRADWLDREVSAFSQRMADSLDELADAVVAIKRLDVFGKTFVVAKPFYRMHTDGFVEESDHINGPWETCRTV